MKKAILTIDDIASKNTPAMVDYLVSKNIKAVMFAVGRNVEEKYDEAVYALKKGMLVGNHSYSHPFFSKLSLEECIAEIEKNEEILNKLYKDAGVERCVRPFRFPYGDQGGENMEALQQYFREHGFDKLDDRAISYLWWKERKLDENIDTYWSFDFAEYKIRPESDFTMDDVMKRIYDSNPLEGGALLNDDSVNLLLLHAHDETEEMYPEYYKKILDTLLDEGVQFMEPGFI